MSFTKQLQSLVRRRTIQAGTETRAQQEHRALCEIRARLLEVQEDWASFMADTQRQLDVKQKHNIQITTKLHEAGKLMEDYGVWAYDRAIQSQKKA